MRRLFVIGGIVHWPRRPLDAHAGRLPLPYPPSGGLRPGRKRGRDELDRGAADGARRVGGRGAAPWGHCAAVAG